MNNGDFIISSSDSILNALKKIDNNNKGFLIVMDNNKVVGTLTDGDIRRQIIAGFLITDTIKVKKDFKSIKEGDSFDNVCQLFRSKIKFFPIVNESSGLVSVITKEQFQALLLQDKKWSTEIDFSSISENNYEVYNRPWGFYKSTLLCDFVQSKILTVFPGEQLSLQEHKRREEHWVIIKGTARAILGESTINIYPGQYIFVPKGCKHQIINDSSESLVLSEVQLGDYFGEDDIKRYGDKYGRLNDLGDEK
jgi:mannose-1-phosphate guanylyltransferase / mannose-6-phosphate isomerase